MSYSVKEVAGIVGVSVRTLHHYDQIGLLKPESVTTAGYRLYSDYDLERLQQILFFKELGFSLKEIKAILDSPGFDRRKALHSQKKLLQEKKLRLEAIIGLVERTIQALEGDKTMSKEEMFKAFDMSEIEKHQREYAEETRRKYGNSDAYKESQKRTANYTKEDWALIQARGNQIYTDFAGLMDKDPADNDVQAAISRWRQHITDSFYNCTLEICRGLGDLYVSDQRFTANIDKYRSGLAKFMQKAIGIYCDTTKE